MPDLTLNPVSLPPVGTQEPLSLGHAGAGDTLKGWETQASRETPEFWFYQQTAKGENTVGVSAEWHTDFSKPASYPLHLHHQKLEGRTEGCRGGQGGEGGE